LRALIFPLGQCRKPPSDDLGHDVAALLSTQGSARDRLTSGSYIPNNENDAVGALEAALSSTLLCEPLQADLAQARKAGKLKSLNELEQISEAKTLGLVTAEQSAQLERDYKLRRKVIMVDDFAP
jgi:acyl-CoA dehydrogenase